MKFVNVVVGILALYITAFAETHITGDITGMTFESSGNPFIVEQDILLPAESKAVIKDGCVFLFKPFTGLTIHGHLAVEGTVENPVIFSSVNDGEFNPSSEQLPNPFDWNGILLSRESGTVSIKNFGLRFSVYGIKSQNTNIILENGLFRQNGQFHFTINDKIQFVQDNIPYSYNGTLVEQDKKPAKPNQPDGKGVSGKPATSTTKSIIRYSCLGIGLVGGICSAIFGVQALNDYSDLNDASTGVIETKYYDEYYNKFKKSQAIAIGTGIVGGLGLTGFVLTFVF